MGVGLVAVKLRAVAEAVSHGNVGDIQASSGGQRQAFIDVEGIESVEAVISVARTGVDRSKADITECVDYCTVPRNGGVEPHDEIRVNESQGVVGVEAAGAVVEAAADQKIISVAEEVISAGGLQRAPNCGRVVRSTVNGPVGR